MRPLPHRWEPLVFPLLLLAAGMFLPGTALAMLSRPFSISPKGKLPSPRPPPVFPTRRSASPPPTGRSCMAGISPEARKTAHPLLPWQCRQHLPPGGEPLSLPPRARGPGLHLRLSRIRPQRRGAGRGRDLRRRPRRPRLAEATGWKPARMIYFGRSLGAAVAVQLALEAPPAGLVLETPFPSVAAMGRHHYSLLYHLLGWALDARYDTVAKICRLRRRFSSFRAIGTPSSRQKWPAGYSPGPTSRRPFISSPEPATTTPWSTAMAITGRHGVASWSRSGPEQARPVDINPERPFSAISVLKKFDLSRGKTGQRKDAKLRTQAQRKSVKLFAPLRLSFPFAP